MIGEMKMDIILNLNSEEEFDGCGDKFSFKRFIKCCENGSFIDYDGFASEIVLNNKVVYSFIRDGKDWLYPSDALANKNDLLELDNKIDGLSIIWCNR
jgi:hypothetical protein